MEPSLLLIMIGIILAVLVDYGIGLGLHPGRSRPSDLAEIASFRLTEAPS
jgi:hypothetical protein